MPKGRFETPTPTPTAPTTAARDATAGGSDPAKRPDPTRISIRVSRAQLERLEARRRGPLSTWLRNLGLGAPLRRPQHPADAELVAQLAEHGRQLARLGDDLSQLVRCLHSGRSEPAPAWEELLLELTELHRQDRELLAELLAAVAGPEDPADGVGR